MCAFYIPWICCGGYNSLLIYIINQIKCMGGWMTSWHTSFTRKEKDKEIDEKKKI
jgi:hypothetical protein